MFLERFQESRWMVEDCRVDLEGLFICLTSNLVKKKKINWNLACGYHFECSVS